MVNRMEIVFILAGLFAGIGGTVGAYEIFGEKPIPACTAEYMEAKGPALCREITCGQSAKAGGAECEQIRNLNNSRAIWDHCQALPNTRPDPRTDSPREACFQLYQTRK